MKKILLLLLLVLSGCQNSNGTTEFELISRTFEINSVSNPCEILKSVNGIIINKSHYIDNKLIVDNEEVFCDGFVTNVVGDQDVSFKYKNDVMVYRVKVVDSTPPIIEIKEKNVQVEVGNKYFSLASLFEVSDNSGEGVKVGYTGDLDINKIGTYKITVTAMDRYNNSNSEEIVVDVVEKEKIVVEVPVENSNIPNNTNNNNNSFFSPPKPNKGNQNIKGINKNFLFADGFDLKSGYEACNVYINYFAQKGYIGKMSCEPIYQGNIAIGYAAVFE